MPRTAARKQRQRIRQLETALAQAQRAIVPAAQRWSPAPVDAIRKARDLLASQSVIDLVNPVYPSAIPRLDPYQMPDTFGAYSKTRLWSGYGSGCSFELLRLAVDRCPLLQAIHSVRLRQVLTMSPYARSVELLGWRPMHDMDYDENTDNDTGDIEARRHAVRRFLECPHPVHDPSFSGFLAKILKDHLTINRVAIELIRNRRGQVVQFRCVDGATILPTFRVLQRFVALNQSSTIGTLPYAYEAAARLLEVETGFPIRDSEYVCVMRGQLVGCFAPGELLVWEFDPHSDVRKIFPPSYAEKALEGIVAWLNAFHYNKNYFTVGNPIEVILGITGEMQDDSFVVLQETLRENFSGLKGAWRVPLVQLSSDQQFQVIRLKANHTEMQFDKWMESLESNATAIYGMHPSEVNLAGRQQRQSVMNQGNKEVELEASGADGLSTVLVFLAECLTKLARLVDPEFGFGWSGLDVEDRDAEIKIETQEIRNYRSINEIRRRRGEEPMEGRWAEIPLDPLVFQAEGLTGPKAMMGEDGAEGDGQAGQDRQQNGATVQKSRQFIPRQLRIAYEAQGLWEEVVV